MKCMETFIAWWRAKLERRTKQETNQETRRELVRVTFILKKWKHILCTVRQDLYDYEMEVREEHKEVPASSEPSNPTYKVLELEDIGKYVPLKGCTVTTTNATFRSIHHPLQIEIQPLNLPTVYLPFGILHKPVRPRPKYYRNVELFEMDDKGQTGEKYEFKIYE